MLSHFWSPTGWNGSAGVISLQCWQARDKSKNGWTPRIRLELSTVSQHKGKRHPTIHQHLILIWYPLVGDLDVKDCSKRFWMEILHNFENFYNARRTPRTLCRSCWTAGFVSLPQEALVLCGKTPVSGVVGSDLISRLAWLHNGIFQFLWSGRNEDVTTTTRLFTAGLALWNGLKKDGWRLEKATLWGQQMPDDPRSLEGSPVLSVALSASYTVIRQVFNLGDKMHLYTFNLSF